MATKLYDICLRRISWFLRDKIKDESPNPFSAIPSRIIHDLINCIVNLYAEGGFRSHFLEPLLLSGQVKHLRLQDIRLDDELLPTLRSFTVCRGLKSLHLINICDFDVDFVRSLLEELVKALKNLEDFHCSVIFSLSALGKCRKLKSVRLHFFPECCLDDILCDESLTFDTLTQFTLCGHRAEVFDRYKEVAEFLVRCPNLKSLGYIDVSAAIEYLHGLEEKTTCDIRHYNLESCCWRKLATIEKAQPKMNFLSSITSAALACPKLKELVIEIPKRHYQDTFPVLRMLKKLTLLELMVVGPTRDFRPEIFDLLSEIGSNLLHLALIKINNVELDTIIKCCPRLVSLKVDCNRVVDDWSDISVNPRYLQRLTFYSKDGSCGNNSLRRMLSKCPNLQELFLKNAEFLNDSFVSRLLKDNPSALAQLKTVAFSECDLTNEGLKKFLYSAGRLANICVDSTKMSEDDVENLIHKTNTSAKFISEYDDGLCYEFFFRRRYACS